MNWGVKITLLYLGFVGLIVTLVSLSLNQKLDLVSDNYYADELKFQEKIDKSSALHQLKGELTFAVTDNAVTITFPEDFKNQNIQGQFYFYCPADKNNDFKSEFNSSDLTVIINTQHLAKGVYTIQLDWTVNNKAYYKEEVIRI